MIYERVISYSDTKPLEVDTTSSKHVVYLRRNIAEVADVDDKGKATGNTHWEMDEARMTKADYDKYLEALNSPILNILLKEINDIKANQELLEITLDELTNREEA